MGDEELRAGQERNGDRYDAALMIEACKRTRAAIARIAGEIAPGMAEEAAQALARRLLKEGGLLRGWHGIHVRFGANTLKTFGETSQPGIILGERDIFFIDIGPVWQGYEGDAGATFVTGDDADMHRAARDVVAVYEATRTAWMDHGLTGAALYGFAERDAAMRGWALNLDMSGHRLSDFPHAVKHDGALADISYAPSPGLWVLEIHIRHPTRPFGAFYEDLLVM
ncbi:M24 family metallopeptidase [Flavisphingomonas formosensis]|uniref:M24 family metallopeptidase n=1 Tax=Flavisphingomonas formosensis TaxID=861534 RepID=UPI0012F9C9BA|nr:M24 family metallopeptidase [Sphingomonas formosensis]